MWFIVYSNTGRTTLTFYDVFGFRTHGNACHFITAINLKDLKMRLSQDVCVLVFFKLTKMSGLYMLSAITMIIIFNFMSVPGFMRNTTLPTKINKKELSFLCCPTQTFLTLKHKTIILPNPLSTTSFASNPEKHISALAV